MEEGDIKTIVSDRSSANLKAIREKQQIDKKFRYEHSNTNNSVHFQKNKASLEKWLAGARTLVEEISSKEDFFMQIAATKALNCFKDPVEAKYTEEQAKKKQAHIIAQNKSRADKKK